MTSMRGALALILLLLSPISPAEEYIKSFHSDIEVRENGDMRVTETIVVNAEGRQIKRGIYRDFPTRYKNGRGENTVVKFEVLSVTRDGAREPFHVENRRNGKRVYIGNANVFLKPGFYEYRLSYLTTRQLGFFDDFDELYWNVTGTGWVFPINRATARVTLPGPVSDFRLTGYTGRQGSTSQNLSHSRVDEDSAYFQSVTMLAPGEGLTIVAGFDKGLVDEPSAAQRRAWFIEDNRAALIVCGGALLLLVYYLLLWHRFGRDPEAGVVIPRYRAPEGFSPASMRFIERMGYDNKCFTSAVINLAVKGALEIDKTGSNFRIRRHEADPDKLAPGEKQMLSGLFPGGGGVIEIEQSNHSILSRAISRHKKSLRLDYEKIFFKTNSWLLAPAILASVLFLYSGFLYSGFTIDDFVSAAAIPLIAGVASMLLMHILFYGWLKAPTLAGRRLLDKVEGFKHYLRVAEDVEIAQRDAPTFTSDLYEAYLPYAIALDLENAWAAKLDRAIAAGLVEPDYSQPVWYHSNGQSPTHFSTYLSNSLNSAIASSSVAPGSDSGSSGGSSGGGGGGGGGGGW